MQSGHLADPEQVVDDRQRSNAGRERATSPPIAQVLTVVGGLAMLARKVVRASVVGVRAVARGQLPPADLEYRRGRPGSVRAIRTSTASAGQVANVAQVARVDEGTVPPDRGRRVGPEALLAEATPMSVDQHRSSPGSPVMA